MRLQYKLNKRWTTLLSGNYQRALGSTTHAEAAFQARPQLFGVGAGLRYGF
jgi:predicted porin